MKLETNVVISVLVLAVGCGDDDSVSTSTDTAYVAGATVVADDDAAMAYAATDALTDPFYLARKTGAAATSNATDDAASSAATSAAHYFTPSDCVNATSSGSKVTYELNSCSGPFDFNTIDGTVEVSFSTAKTSAADAGSADAQDAVAFKVSSIGLTINGDKATLASSGTYTRNASGKKQVKLSSMSTRVRDDRQVRNDTSTTLSWMSGSQCIDLESSGKVASGIQNLDLAIDNYKRCAGACPKSGTVRLAGAQTVTLALDGTDHPVYKSTDGLKGTVNLDCGS